MTTSTVRIPKGQYYTNDPTLRWDGQEVRVLRESDGFAWVYCPALRSSTTVPLQWLREKGSDA